MSANQYRSELIRKRNQRVNAEKRASGFRIKEASKRSEATKARAAAARASSASTASMRIREAARKDTEADAAGKEVGAWQRRAASYSKQEAVIQEKLSRAEQSEAATVERRRQSAERSSAAASRQRQLAIDLRLDQQQAQISHAMQTIRPPKPERLRILMLSASAEGDLRIGREAKRIRAGIQSALGRDLVDLDIRTAATTDDLLDGLTSFRPHVVHFSGHSEESFVVFEEDADVFNEGVMVDAGVFSRALAAVDEPPLLVLLNSCNSESQATRLASEVVPFAIGMSDEIYDTDAITYAAAFYSAIANGQTIAAADRIGKVSLELAGLSGYELPTLSSALEADAEATRLVVLPADSPPVG